jgi:hypothetical protein
VVLKEETRWIEFYYRSVLPGKHYIGFTKQSAWQVGLQHGFYITICISKHVIKSPSIAPGRWGQGSCLL